MTDIQFNHLLYMLEALRLEIRAATLVQMRSESAAKAFPAVFNEAERFSRLTGIQ